MTSSCVRAVFFSLLFTASLMAEIRERSVEYKAGDSTFVGHLVWDDAVASATAPRPAVMVCPEWWGCNAYAKGRARQLAELGYVSFAIDVYGKGADGNAKTTANPKQAGEWAGAVMGNPASLRERVTAAHTALSEQKFVDPSRVAAIGYCMGGTVALELARTGASVKAVVAFHTSSLAAKNPDDNTNIKGVVLICHGDEDAFVQPGELENCLKQFRDAGVDFQLASYAGAVHSFTNIDADSFGIAGVKYDARADRRSWRNMLTIFAETLGEPKASGATVGKAPKAPAPGLSK